MIVEPRGLPRPQYKDPPPRRYRVNAKKTIPHPSAVFDHFGSLWYWDDEQKVSRPYRPEPVIEMRKPREKSTMPTPLPGLTKPSKGHKAPVAGTTTDRRRKWTCPVETCRKAFLQRSHLKRHIETIHNHPTNVDPCLVPLCDFHPTRVDNRRVHVARHSHDQEIFLCSLEDDFKGLQLQNPHVVHHYSADIKPFKDISIVPLSLDLWCFKEAKRRNGEKIPRTDGDVERYFRAHPEQIDAALRKDEEWVWKMPPAGPEFSQIDARCLKGKFRLDIKKQSDDD
ncbi:hypothetical protein BD413DRAFT_466605 [Trametes elegans]|nr:hypothetical protein BD413DRAFT_466605 [Trametes elegans]